MVRGLKSVADYLILGTLKVEASNMQHRQLFQPKVAGIGREHPGRAMRSNSSRQSVKRGALSARG